MLVLAVSATRVQMADGLKAPAPSVVKVTVPAGADLVPEAVSVTVAVHRLPSLTATLAGVQDTLVLVVRRLTVIAEPERSLLLLCTPSVAV